MQLPAIVTAAATLPGFCLLNVLSTLHETVIFFFKSTSAKSLTESRHIVADIPVSSRSATAETAAAILAEKVRNRLVCLR